MCKFLNFNATAVIKLWGQTFWLRQFDPSKGTLSACQREWEKSCLTEPQTNQAECWPVPVILEFSIDKLCKFELVSDTRKWLHRPLSIDGLLMHLLSCWGGKLEKNPIRVWIRFWQMTRQMCTLSLWHWAFNLVCSSPARKLISPKANKV